ncbi:MAG: ABC transporter ATP-binding protein [Treponema sp.]|jgi:NitT/TauT family transport system ATP-binding protein|nr:ABC transporter ATP-binding protein [Treponema sp.]
MSGGSGREEVSIEMEGLSFGFGERPIFQDLNLRLGDASPVAILGPSGCGKTTLLRLVAGLLRPQGGTLRIRGPAEKVSFVFQEPRLFPWLRVLENVSLPVKGMMGKKDAEDRARRLLALVSLEDRARAYPGELSGGQRQRVSIARAFAYPAPILCMDEPFQSLDIPLRLQLMDLILTLLKAEPRLVLTVTHDPREAVYMGRRILVLGPPPGGPVIDEPLPREERVYGEPGPMEGKLLRILAGR